VTPVQVANLALSEIGSRVSIASFADNSPQAKVAALNYTPRIQMLLRAATWDFARAQANLSVWKQATVNGVISSNPPPQPWLFSYLWPSDALKARFVLPTIPVQPPGTPLTTTPGLNVCVPPVPTGIPFVIGTDIIPTGNTTSPVKVILTNLPNAQLIYTRDLSQMPDQWDSLFLSAATAFLGTYFINALARNKAQYDDQVAMAKSLLDQARVANGNDGIGSVDHTPDWLLARNAGGRGSWGAWYGPGNLGCGVTADSITFPGGLRY
jgi:hypothetical protein